MRFILLAILIAAAMFAAGCASAPEQSPPPEDAKYFNRGVAAEAKGRYYAALDHYSRFIETQGDENSGNLVAAYNNRATVLWKLNRFDECLEDFKKAAELDPNVALTFINRGNVYADMGQTRKAIDDYTRAIDLDPENGLAYSNRGLAWSGIRRFDMALPDFDKAIELGHPGLHISLMKRGVLRFGTKQHQEAVDDFSRVIKLMPNYTDAYFYRGQAFQAMGETDKAQKDLYKVMELKKAPSNPKSAVNQ